MRGRGPSRAQGICLSGLLAVLSGCAAAAPARLSERELEPLVRERAFREQPDLQAQTRFLIEEYEIPGLWDAMTIQLLRVRYLAPDGSQFHEALLVRHEAKLTPFAETFGGHGLLSAALAEDGLYYSYSWGSGQSRSHVGRISRAGSGITIIRSDGYPNVDLFVKRKDGRLSVESGRFLGFNRWDRAEPVGGLQAGDGSITVLESAESEQEAARPAPTIPQ